VEFSVLGPLSVRTDSTEVVIRGTKPRALLCLLLIRANQVVAADRLIEDLWEGNPPESAAGTLQSHISTLRRFLGHDRLQTRGGGYVLEVAAGELDAARFEAELSDAGQLLGGGDAAGAVGRLTQALDRWRGNAFGEFASASSAIAEASRLEEERLVAVETLLEARLALGQNTVVAVEAEAAIRQHPLRERLWAHLIVALYRQGRQADALRAYTRLRATLLDELGIDPSPELRNLEQAVLAQHPSLGLLHSPAGATQRPAVAALPTGLVTFLLTDVVGSTRLWDTAPRPMAAALETHDTLIRQVVEAHGGVLLKARGEGDSTFSVFRRATHAAAAALQLQAALEAADWPQECVLSVRMALHTGEAQERDGDYYGPTVNRASRLRAVAEASQILVSRATADVIIDHLPPEARLVELGSQPLRDLERPETIYLLAGATDSMLADQPTTSPIRIPLPGRLASPVGVIFVGRTEELALLGRRMKEAADDQRRVVLVAGEPGIGKTTLAAEAARAAYAAGAVVLHGRCDEDLGMPYQPFAEALGHLVEHLPSIVIDRVGRKRLGDLGRLVPAAAEWAGSGVAIASRDAETDRWLAFEAVVSVLATVSADEPIMLILDDLQWADRATLLLLRHIAAASQPLRLLTVGTYRDSELSSAHPLLDTLASLRREVGVERIALSGLSDLDLVTLLESAAGHTMDDPGVGLAHALRRETDGNPFFVWEILRHLDETGVAAPKQGQWFLREDPAELGLPDSVREVVGRRVARLGPVTQRTLTTGAVIGTEFELDVLATALHASIDEVLAALEGAENAALVLNVEPGRFSFAHALVQHTLYTDLSPTRRAQAHRAVAEAIERLGQVETRVAELARHWAAAAGPTESDLAVDYALKAGNQALRSLAPDDAVRWYQQALDLLGQRPSPDRSRRCQLLVRLGRAQRQAGDAGFRQTLLDAAALARQLGDTEQLVRAALASSPGIGAFWHVDADVIDALQAALAAVGPADSVARARLLATLASETILLNDVDVRQTMSDEAVAIARRLGDRRTLLQVLNLRYSTIWVPSTLEERVANTAEAMGLAESLGDPGSLFWAASWRQRALLETADIAGAEQCRDIMGEIAEELALPLLRSVDAMMRGEAAIRAANFDEAERLHRERTELAEALGVEELMAAGSAFDFTIRWFQGRAGEAVDSLRLQVMRRNVAESQYLEAMLAFCYLEVGRSHDAKALLGDALRDPTALLTKDNGGHLAASTMWAEVCAAIGSEQQVATLYDLLAPLERNVGVHSGTCLPVAHSLGILAARLGCIDDADHHFGDSAALSGRISERFHLARTQLAWSRILLVRRNPGDFDRGIELAEQALAAARRYGYAGVERSALDLLASAAARPDPPPLPARLGALGAGNFVGRDRERHLLAERLAEVSNGRRLRVVLIEGEPGVGKTALVAQAAVGARASGARVLYGRCDEDLRVPYEPFVESLGQVVLQVNDELLDRIGDRSLAELARLIPDVRERKPDLPSPVASDPETERYLLMNAAVTTLAAASDDTATVLVLDDLQWADQSTLLLLRQLVSSAPNARLLILATLQEDTATAELRREPAVEQLTLAGLNDGEVAAMTGANEELARTLHRETDGNPFFVTELFRHLTETGSGVPASVRGVISSRVNRLGADVARMLTTAAVIGQEFALDVLAAVLGEDADSILDILERAERAALIGTLTPERFAFTHALIQQALHEDVAPTRRSRLHRQVGEALGVIHDDASVLDQARHWVQAAVSADDIAIAVGHCRRAGDHALAALAPDEAVRWYRQALELADRLRHTNGKVRCELLVALGDAQCRAGDRTFRETVVAAGDLALRLGETDLLVRAALTDYQRGVPTTGADFDRVRLLEAALDRVGPADTAARALLLAKLGFEVMLHDPGRFRALGEEGRAVAGRLGDPGTLVDTLLAGAFLDDRYLALEALQVADTLGDPARIFRAAYGSHFAAMSQGDLQQADGLLARMVDAAEGLGPDVRWMATYTRADRAIIAGDVAEAERLAEEAYTLGRALEQPGATAIYAAEMAAIRWHQGRLNELASLIAEVARDNPALPLIALTSTFLNTAEPDRDLSAALHALPGDAADSVLSAMVLSDAVGQRDDTEAARRLYEQLLPVGPLFAFGNICRGAVAHALGVLARVLSRYDDADEHFAAAAAMHERMQAPFHQARTWLEWGRMLLQRRAEGDLERAIELLERSRDTAAQYGCAQVERRALRLLASRAARPDPPPLPRRLAGSSRGVFVGRHAELRTLAARLSEVEAGALRLVLVAGEPGMGKTTLAAHSARTAHSAGVCVLFGECEEGAGAPYQPWIAALSHLVRHTDPAVLARLLPVHSAPLRRLLATDTDRLPEVEPTVGDPDTERFVLMEAVASLLELTSTVMPVLVVIDDLHWADAASLQLLRHLVSSPVTMRVLMLGTYRASDLSRTHPLTALLADLRREQIVSRVELAGLDEPAVVGLMEAAAGHPLDEASIGLARTLQRETDGNAFFVVELLRHRDESGPGAGLPGSIREVVGRRVARLGDKAMQVLSRAAVIGRDFELDVLTRIGDIDQDELLDILEAAGRAELVAEDEGPKTRYRFVHALIQQTLYEDLSTARCRRTHERVAEALETLGAEAAGRFPELARHWLAAATPKGNQKALHYAHRAADAARSGLAPLDAVAWYEEALDLLGEMEKPEERLRCQLLSGLADVQSTAGLPEFRVSKREAGMIARRLDDPDLLTSVVLSQTLEHWQDSQSVPDPEWIAVLEAALTAAGPMDSDVRARLLAALVTATDPRDWRRRSELSNDALAVARRVGGDATILTVLASGYDCSGPDRLGQRLVESAEAVALAERLAQPVSAYSARRYRLLTCAEACDLAEVDRLLVELDSIVAQTRLPPLEYSQAMVWAWRHTLAGDLAQAEAMATRTFELGSRIAHPVAFAAYATQLASIRSKQGRSAEVADVVARAAADTPSLPALRSGVAGLSLLQSGEGPEALLAHDVATGFEGYPYDVTWLTTMSNCAATAVRLEHREAAQLLYNRLAPFADHLAFTIAADQGVVARRLGLLAALLGRDTDAEDNFRLALDLHERLEAPYWIARTQIDYADLLLRRNQRGDAKMARDLLSAAGDMAGTRGYAGLRRRLTALVQ
jgi:predicted ATPase/DNA-binding SARP family transcriptional activator/class 3 adenylate cyclase